MLVIAIVAALLVSAAGFAFSSSRALAATSAHEMPSRREFLAAYDGRAVPAELLVQLYETLGRRLAGAGARVRPTARLAEELGLTAEDVEDVALLVLARCHGRLPHAADLDALVARVRTVGELVEFLTPFCATEPVAMAA